MMSSHYPKRLYEVVIKWWIKQLTKSKG
jgi:hypothetical protein